MNGLGKVVGCGIVEATVRQHTQPELDSLRHLEPVQIHILSSKRGSITVCISLDIVNSTRRPIYVLAASQANSVRKFLLIPSATEILVIAIFSVGCV